MDNARAEIPGKWVIVRVRNGSTRVVVRLRTEWPTDKEIASYTTAVTIAWHYVVQEGKVKPSDEVNQQMIDFETAIDELLMDNGISYLMAVATGLGLKEWVYYAKGSSVFMARFNALLSEQPTYPLKIEFIDDPTWKCWAMYRHAYERSGGEPAVRPPGIPFDPSVGWFARLRKRFGFGPEG